MNEFMNNPIFQSALIPFAIALAAALLIRPKAWSGLGFILAYGVSVYVTIGFQILPFTSTRKILLFTALAVCLGIMLDLYAKRRRFITWLIVALSIAAAVWLAWPLLKRADGTEWWILLLSTTVYAAILIPLFERLRNDTLRSATASLSLGMGTGISAILGASALLGQLGGAIAAAAGAYTLVWLFSKHLVLRSHYTLAIAVPAAFIGLAAVLYAGMIWYALIPLALIPLTAYIPVKQQWNRFIQTVVVSLYSLIPAAVAIALTWHAAQSSEPSFY